MYNPASLRLQPLYHRWANSAIALNRLCASSLHFGPPPTDLGRFSDVRGTDVCYTGPRGCIYRGQPEAMNDVRQGYQACLVRLWRVRSSGRWVWRAALESPHTGERQVFGDLAGLFAHLERQTGGFDLAEPAEDGTGDDGLCGDWMATAALQPVKETGERS